MAELHVTQVGTLARLTGIALSATQVGALARMTAEGQRVSQFGVLVRLVPTDDDAVLYYAFGLREVKFVCDGDVVALDAAQLLSIRERVKSGQLSGNDQTQAVAASSDVIEWELEAGGIPIKAYSLIAGRVATLDVGTLTMVAEAQEVFPYFAIYGKSIADPTGDIHVKVCKAKLTQAMAGLFEDDTFWMTNCAGVGIRDDTGRIYEVVQHVTETDLPV